MLQQRRTIIGVVTGVILVINLKNVPDQDQDDAESMEYDVEQYAYAELYQYIRNDIVFEHEVVTLNSLTKKIEEIMLSKGLSTMKDSTRTHIRRKLETEFGNSLRIISNEKGKLLVLPDNVSRYELAERYYEAKQELQKWREQSSDTNSTITQASSFIRTAIMKMDSTTQWPIHPSDVTSDSLVIPAVLKHFLMGLLTGKPEYSSPPQRVAMLLDSFSQDIIYGVTHSRCKPPKQILLGYGVKTLTGNVELVWTLNWFGHSVSYSQLEENDMALCLQKLAAALNEQVILPESIQPYLFTNLAFDNLDRLEEMLTGAGTTHRVNGIAVQPRVYGSHPQKLELPEVEKLKQRSVISERKQLPTYIAGVRCGPQPLHTTYTDDSRQQHKTAADEAQSKDFIWLIARQVDTENQIIPSWTGST